MALPKLTYEDFKARISIQEVLQDAGYHLNRRDGLRYPSYVRLGSDGRRVSGDKFIVSANGMCCFQPPERKNYNIISFIKAHPHFFSDYRPGMSPDRLVNVVCHRLLNQPLEERQTRILDPVKERKPFTMMDYEFSSQRWHIARFLIARGIGKSTQEAFEPYMKVSYKKRDDGKQFGNLSFPLTIPGNKAVVGMELRGFPNKEGKTTFKGMATGSDATHGLWIANPSGRPLNTVRSIYWFESAYDAMSYYQLNSRNDSLYDATFISTSGSPSKEQFQGVFREAPQAEHHLCFDRDRAGQLFAVNFALTKSRNNFTTVITDDGILKVSDMKNNYEFRMDDFNFDAIAKELGIEEAVPYPSEWQPYVDSIVHKDDVLSGEAVLLVGEAGKAYGRYESLCEEYYSSSHSGLVCKEDLNELGEQLREAKQQYLAEMKKVFPIWPTVERRIIYEPCDPRYKDWNDQLRDIPKQEESAEIKEERQGGLKR